MSKIVPIELLRSIDVGSDFTDGDAIVLPKKMCGKLKPYYPEGTMLAHFDNPLVAYLPLEEGEDYKVLPESALSLEDCADNVYGSDNWHSSGTLKKPFRKGRQCYCCTETATERAIVNTWGSVCEYDMCPEHVERYANKCVDVVTSYKEAKMAS